VLVYESDAVQPVQTLAGLAQSQGFSKAWNGTLGYLTVDRLVHRLVLDSSKGYLCLDVLRLFPDDKGSMNRWAIRLGWLIGHQYRIAGKVQPIRCWRYDGNVGLSRYCARCNALHSTEMCAKTDDQIPLGLIDFAEDSSAARALLMAAIHTAFDSPRPAGPTPV
jgi:hypothetical protein